MAKQLYAVDILDHVQGDGIKERFPVKTISLTNIDINTDITGNTVSGYVISAGDRIILNGQTTDTENGIYVVDTTLIRAADYYSGNLSNSFVTVTAGDYMNTVWQATADGTVGVGPQSFKMSANINYVEGNIFYARDKYIDRLAPTEIGSVLTMTGSVPEWTSPLTVVFGGTGQYSFTEGSIILGNGSNALNNLEGVAWRNLGTDSTGTYVNTNNAFLTTIKAPDATEQLFLGFTDTVSSEANFRITNSNPLVFSAEGTATDITMNLQVKGAGTVDLKTPGTAGQLRFWGSTSYVGLKSDSTQAAPVVFTLPTVDGTNGQYLQTNGSGVLSFSTAASGITNLTLASDEILVNVLSLTAISTISYHTAAYGASKAATIYYEVAYNNNFTLQVWNDTTSTQLASASITSAGFKTLDFTTPAANARIQIRVLTLLSVIGYSSIRGMQLRF